MDISFVKESTFVEEETYPIKLSITIAFCKCCRPPHGRIHAHTREPLYSEFAILADCPSQLNMCTKTIRFILLPGQFKQMIFSEHTCLNIQRRQRSERLNISSEAIHKCVTARHLVYNFSETTDRLNIKLLLTSHSQAHSYSKFRMQGFFSVMLYRLLQFTRKLHNIWLLVLLLCYP